MERRSRTNGGRTVVIPNLLAAFIPVISRIGPCVLQCPIFRASLFATSLHPHFTCTSLLRNRPEHTHNAVHYQIIGFN